MPNTKAAGASGGQRRSGAGMAQLHAYHTTKPGGGQFVWYEGRRVASVDSDGVLRRTLHSDRHIYRGEGIEEWSFHTPVILLAKRLGAQAIEVKDADTGMIYRADFHFFLSHARVFSNDWGPQMALALSAWNTRARSGAGGQQLTLL